MAVNTSFYIMQNELAKRATNGAVSGIVNYDTFVDAGKKLAEMDIEDLVNHWMTPFANKVQKTLSDNPEYVGALVDMETGTMDYGVLETILGTFYDMEESEFDGDTLKDGEIYLSQFKYSKPDIEVVYHMNSASWGRDISVRYTDIKGAFANPGAMEGFTAVVFGSVANSINYAKEVSRMGLLAAAIVSADSAEGEKEDETKLARRYDLVSIYNHKHGTELDENTAMENDAFVEWADLTINDIANLIGKPSTLCNELNFKTFTPNSHKRLKISSLFEKALKRTKIGAYNPENLGFDVKPEVLPYWQNITDRLRVTTNTEDESETTYSSPVIACLYDKRALREMVQLEDVTNTPNNKRKFVTYHWAMNRMYTRLKQANFIIFTLS